MIVRSSETAGGLVVEWREMGNPSGRGSLPLRVRRPAWLRPLMVELSYIRRRCVRFELSAFFGSLIGSESFRILELRSIFGKYLGFSVVESGVFLVLNNSGGSRKLARLELESNNSRGKALLLVAL